MYILLIISFLWTLFIVGTIILSWVLPYVGLMFKLKSAYIIVISSCRNENPIHTIQVTKEMSDIHSKGPSKRIELLPKLIDMPYGLYERIRRFYLPEG